MMRRLLLLPALLALLILGPRPAEAERSLRVFFFGNSLIHHLTESDATTVPYWLARLARAGGHRLAADGVWGFPADFARALPPRPQWGIEGVPRVMGEDPRSFRRAGFDMIVLAPPNFVQDRPPERDSLDGAMLDLIARTFDWAANQTGARFLIYAGWADMGPYGFPPSARSWRRWLEWNRGGHARWHEALVAGLRARLPEAEIGLIPVAPVLAALVAEGPLEGLGAADLFTDDAPHGTATTYLLAAMISYAVLYGEPPPALELPPEVHPLLRERYKAVAAAVWAGVSGAVLPEGALLRPPETGLADPALAWGLAGVDDWSPQAPFLDLMKTARPWIGHLPGQWGGVSFEELRAGGHLDAQGWPLSIPEGVQKLETLILTDLPQGARSLAGRYLVTWQGRGRLVLGGRARDVAAGPEGIRFSFTPGPGPVAIAITATDPADPIRSIRVVREDRLPLVEAGALFNPDWLRVIRDARVIRFMDWMRTNGSPLVAWEDRPRVEDFSYAWRGVPVEVMVRLANEIGADPWFTLPHMADDGHVRGFATYVRDHLDPRLRVHAEWSNEVWNFLFPQADWARAQALRRWGAAAGEDGWMQFAGSRAAEVADIWAEVFGAEAEARLVRVVATHTGWPGLETALLEAPLRQAEGLPPPAASFDAYAVTGYFGFELGQPGMAGQLHRWIARGTAEAEATRVIREGSLRDLKERLWPHHAAVAAAHGLRLLMYEGGTHVTGSGAVIEDEVLTAFFSAYNYSAGMAGLYAEALAAWRALGGGPFNAFVDVGPPGKWGSWGALRHLDDVNPRAATLAAWNGLPSGEAGRDPAAFLHGVIRIGTEGDDRLEGTAQADILVGGAGDDLLLPGGGADRLHGGPGRDRVLLPGVAADWTLAGREAGGAVLLAGPGGVTLRLVDVEEAGFAAEPGALLTLEEGG